MLAAKAFFDTPVAELTPRMEQEFFSSLMTSNKTYKTTFHQRFADINPSVVQLLQEQGLQNPSVLDIGISSGVSTLELYDDFHAGGLDAKVVASDILLNAFLVRVLPGCHALVDPNGFPLRFDMPFGTMKPWVTRRDYWNGLFVLRKAISTMLARRARRTLKKPGDYRTIPVKLVTPRLLANENVVICNDDIQRYNHRFTGKFDFVRAANVLNKGYFAPDVLASMLVNIRHYLAEPWGALLVVRTHEDRINHGTLFRLGDGQRFEVVRRFGDGSEIEDLVLQCTNSAEQYQSAAM